MHVDLATERELHRQRHAAHRAAQRPGTLLRSCNPGATEEELRLEAQTRWQRALTAEEIEEIVQAALLLQLQERANRIDPATVRLSSASYDPDRKAKRTADRFADHIEEPSNDAILGDSDESAQDSDQMSETEPQTPAATPETTVPSKTTVRGKPGNRKPLPPPQRAKAVAWIALQLLLYPKIQKFKLHSGLFDATGVVVSFGTFHDKLYPEASKLAKRLPKESTLAELNEIVSGLLSDWGVPHEAPAPQDASALTEAPPASEPVAEAAEPSAAEPLVTTADGVGDATEVRCYGCGRSLPVGEKCSDPACPESRRIQGENLVITGAAPAEPAAAAPLEAIAHEPSQNGKAVQDAPSPAAGVIAPALQGGGVLRTERGLLKHQVRRDGTYVVLLELTTRDPVLFAEAVGLGMTGLLGAEVARG